MPLFWGQTPTYAAIEDGQWLDDTLPYGTVHRLASAGKHKGVASAVLDWSMEHCQSLRADTHADNKIMQHLLEKNGFTRCGVIHVADGSPALPTRSLPPPSRWVEKQNTPSKSPGLRMQSLPCRTAHAGFFVCPRSLRPALLDGDGENKAANGQTCPCYKYRSMENPHGHRPECKFVNEKCLKTLSISLPYVL